MKIASTGTEESASRRCANVGYAGSSSNAAACARVCHTVPAKRIQKYIKCLNMRSYERASMVKRALTQEPEIFVRSLHRRAPILRCEAFVTEEGEKIQT